MRLIEVARFVGDVGRTVAFYEGLLGTRARWEGGAAFLDVGGVTLLIHERYRPGPGELPPEDHVAFGVGDLEAACRDLVARGYRFEAGPADWPWGRSAYLRDPEGRLVELHEVRGA